MSQADENVVLKYCELLDEFIRIRTTSEDPTRVVLRAEGIRNRASYHELVVATCVVDYETQVLPLFQRHNKVYQTEALVELLYQICIEVNPHLEIHSVTLPGGPAEATTTADARPAPEQDWLAADELLVFQERVHDIEQALGQRIIGQQTAVSAIAHAVKKAAVGLQDPRRPLGVFLLVGPTGTGKTEMAKALTRQLFGGPSSLVRIDCSEYALPHEYAKLIGAPPGYIGHNEGGQLTEAVKKQRHCVVLFDEIEKAHEKVHNLLLQLMDEGTLTDSRGEKVSFHRSVVLMTSNIGMEDVRRLNERVGFGTGLRPDARADAVAYTVGEAVKRTFRPEFVNRIDRVVQFRPLTVADCERIAALQLAEMSGYLGRTGVALRFSRALTRHLGRLGWSPEFGARELRRHIRDEVEEPLIARLLAAEFRAGDVVTLGVRGKGKLVMTKGRRASRGSRTRSNGDPRSSQAA